MIEGYAKPKQKKIEEVRNNEQLKNYHIERKADGSRQFLIQGRTLEMRNKRGKDKTRHFPDITKNVELPRETVLDGEIIVTDEKHEAGNRTVLSSRDGGQPVISKSGRKNFKPKMKMRQYPATFVAFDITRYKGQDMKDKPIEKRREILEKVCSNAGEELRSSKRYEDLETAWKKIEDKKQEGLVLKKPESHYPKDRDSKWFKVKNKADTVVTAVDYSEHSRGVTVTARDEHSDQHRVTVNGKQSEEVKRKIDENGEVKGEITYLEMTKNDSLREPTWKRLVE